MKSGEGNGHADPLPLGADGRVDATTSNGMSEALLWRQRTPSIAGETVGVIGGFHATSREAAEDVLTRATAELRAHGCTLAIGPMDGSTWRRYRLVTDVGTEPAFFMEPTNPAEWPVWWRAVGFEPIAEYCSTVTDTLSRGDDRLVSVRGRMTAAGVTLRPLDLGRFEQELRGIFDVSIISFQTNYLFTPISWGEFAAQYRAGKTQFVPDLIWIAEQANRTVGYVFAVPDFAQRARGEAMTTMIVKTLAVLPGRAFAGLGALLLDTVHREGQRLGYRRAIHALMHQSNASVNLSTHTARPMRRYALFARRLAPLE
jgi:L-amino acid N-acyltransferase YncA